MTRRRWGLIAAVAPLALIGCVLAAFILFAGLNFDRLEAETAVLCEGRSMFEGRSAQQGAKPGDADAPAVLSVALGEEFAEARSACFYSTFQTVRVSLDGVELYRFDKPPGERMMRAAPSYWNVVDIPGGSRGATLEIELTSPYRQYASVLPEVRCGTRAQIERYVAFKTLPRFAVALAILFVGVIFGIVAVVMRYYLERHTGLYALSLFIVMLAVFLLAQQTTILLEFDRNVSYILIQNAAFMLCPMLYTLYQIRVNSGWRRKVSRALFWLSAANAALITALQLAGIRDMPQVMGLTGALSALVIGYAFVLELLRRRRLLVCAYALLMIYAPLRYYFTDDITWLVYAGIFGYLYVLLYRVISSVVKAQAKQIRLRAALEVSKSEIAAIQITSHFFYHTLDAIRALIRLDADQAYKMTGDFAKYVRHRVDGVERMREPVPFARELRAIRAYVDIKRAQLGGRFAMEYDIEAEDFEILPLTVQPLVENAVVHAAQRRSDGGLVRLSCRETQDGYHIEVADNGPDPGAEPPPEGGSDKRSTAIRNVNTRLEFCGIAPVRLERNALGGMTASLDMPKNLAWREEAL